MPCIFLTQRCDRCGLHGPAGCAVDQSERADSKAEPRNSLNAFLNRTPKEYQQEREIERLIDEVSEGIE